MASRKCIANSIYPLVEPGMPFIWVMWRERSHRPQRMFTDNDIVLGDYSEDWIVEQFFWETLGLSYDSISEVVINTWAGPGMLSLQEMESHVIEVCGMNK